MAQYYAITCDTQGLDRWGEKHRTRIRAYLSAPLKSFPSPACSRYRTRFTKQFGSISMSAQACHQASAKGLKLIIRYTEEIGWKGTRHF